MKLPDGLSLLDDGRWLHRQRQSTLTSYNETCPEGVRAELYDPSLRRETDAAAIGSAVHAGIEWALEALFAAGEQVDVEEMLARAIPLYEQIEAMPNFFSVKYPQNGIKARQLIREALEKWRQQVLPKLWPSGSEIGFKGLLVHEDAERVIQMNGTMDYLDAEEGLCDWKTSSGPYTPWEKQRWSIQATTYVWAAVEMGLLDPEAESWPFTFVIMQHGAPEVQFLPVIRTRQHFAWLRTKSVEFAKALELSAHGHEWHRRDSGWWCSGKWCANFSSCKGLVLPTSTEGKP
jgi:hypothetical protein